MTENKYEYTVKEISTWDIEKIYQSLLKGNNYTAVRLECGNPPNSLIAKVRKNRFPDSINMNSKELERYRNKLFMEYLKDYK